MSELSLSARMTFSTLETAVAVKHLFRQWNDSGSLLAALLKEFAERIPQVTELGKQLDALLQEFKESDEIRLRNVSLTFIGNRDTRFYYKFSPDDYTIAMRFTNIVIEWVASLPATEQVVLMTIGDEYDFTVYEHGKTYSADTGGEPSFYDWIMAQSDGELPGESFDLPIWYKTYEKDLEVAKVALRLS
ncbi:MAG: hypothetical protein ACJA0I_000016 [Gammaproteobacteria bacterium]|jgi:hypothetical protein|uniref:hypothetical protein n=1 Tax=Thalassolituus sp. UBA3500 TaxID=1947664 RepID=UPI000C0E7699|nr:hypothetical protein [Thalassolituus sp. UBA3500]MBN58035.1 hypothetical protein [Oceanospirillaceae bacterium]